MALEHERTEACERGGHDGTAGAAPRSCALFRAVPRIAATNASMSAAGRAPARSGHFTSALEHRHRRDRADAEAIAELGHRVGVHLDDQVAARRWRPRPAPAPARPSGTDRTTAPRNRRRPAARRRGRARRRPPASGASIGAPGGASIVPHPPHLASLALNGTRFFRPHWLHATITPRSSIARAMTTG